jgi:hypothetical protein
LINGVGIGHHRETSRRSRGTPGEHGDVGSARAESRWSAEAIMSENTARLTVGRLLEVRADAGYRSPADVEAIFQAIGREVGKLPPNAPHVTVVDWRHCPLMSPEAAEHMLKKIAGLNTNTLRSAALASDSAPLAVLQFVRLIRDAKLPDRKLFTNAHELEGWLAEVLTLAEQARLRVFLAEGTAARGVAGKSLRSSAR